MRTRSEALATETETPEASGGPRAPERARRDRLRDVDAETVSDEIDHLRGMEIVPGHARLARALA